MADRIPHKPTRANSSSEKRLEAREILQSVAWFLDATEYNDPNQAFRDSAQKITQCFEYLSDFLVSIQSSLPYLVSWQIYPISQFDVGLVYHQVDHFCPTKNNWTHLKTGVSINLTRQLHQPVALLDLKENSSTDPAIGLSDELLAEGQAALFRGYHRGAVINSYQAVESLANVVYKQKQIDRLLADGIAESDAEPAAEKIRKENRTKIRFLLHSGLIAACGQSLLQHDQAKYERIVALGDLRHLVAHAGRKPTRSEAEAAHTLCCEVVQWLCGVFGAPIRPLLPDAKQMIPGLVSLPADINVIPGLAKAFLLWILGVEPTEDCLQAACQFGLTMKFKEGK